MLMAGLDSLATRIVVRWGWRENEKRLLERITTFETTEDDSAWQLLRLSTESREPRAKAKLFLQSLEESHHAEIFRELHRTIAREAGEPPFRKLVFERKPLAFDQERPWRLFASLAVGESAAARRFRSIAESLPRGEFRLALEKILAEEEGHVALAESLMLTSGGLTPFQAKAELTRIRLARAKDAWLRLGQKLTLGLSRVLLAAVFYSIGGFLSQRRSPRSTR